MSKITIFFLFSGLLVHVVSSSLMREGKITGDLRLQEPEIKKCMDLKPCPITLDYRPTCASDGKTYSNGRVIDCLNECLKPDEKLTVASGGFCKNDIAPNN